VPAAILFDLSNGGDKAWGENPPYAALGMKACEAASLDFSLGNAGAGLGARAGAYKGGLGSASWTTADGYTVGALVAANPFGSPAMPGGTLWAAAFEQNGELGKQRAAKPAPLDLDFPGDIKAAPVQAGANTTIGVVAVDAMLTPAEARRIAIMAQDGYARAVRPIHTMGDGDVIFVLATGKRAVSEPRALLVSRLGSIAADCVARATARGVFEAKTLGAFRSYRDAWPGAFG
jgi:L-aminopeptidase/D-esterase-like protein